MMIHRTREEYAKMDAAGERIPDRNIADIEDPDSQTYNIIERLDVLWEERQEAIAQSDKLLHENGELSKENVKLRKEREELRVKLKRSERVCAALKEDALDLYSAADLDVVDLKSLNERLQAKNDTLEMKIENLEDKLRDRGWR